MTFLKSGRWKLQATPTSPILAPPYPILLDATLFSKKAFGAWKLRPSSSSCLRIGLLFPLLLFSMKTQAKKH